LSISAPMRSRSEAAKVTSLIHPPERIAVRRDLVVGVIVI
jgi:hypothetical protein